MQHNTMLMANVEIEQAQLQAQARAERRARGKRNERRGGLFARLRRR